MQQMFSPWCPGSYFPLLFLLLINDLETEKDLAACMLCQFGADHIFSAGFLLHHDWNYYHSYIIIIIVFSVSFSKGWLSPCREALLEVHHNQYAATYCKFYTADYTFIAHTL